MKMILMTLIAVLALAGCDYMKPKPTDLDEVSGVWLDGSGKMLRLEVAQLKGEACCAVTFVADDTYVPMTLTPNDNPGDGIVSMTVDGDEAGMIWTLRVTATEDGGRRMVVTFPDGSQAPATLVRRITEGDRVAMDMAVHPAGSNKYAATDQ